MARIPLYIYPVGQPTGIILLGLSIGNIGDGGDDVPILLAKTEAI